MDDDSDQGAARAAADRSREHACPHVNLNDVRCGSRFSLGRLEQAFSVCFGSYRGCPMYHRINAEETSKRQDITTSTSADVLVRLRPQPTAHSVQHSALRSAPLPEVTITANGRSIPLRPTGT